MFTNQWLATFVHTVMKKHLSLFVTALVSCLLFFHAHSQIIIQQQTISDITLPEGLINESNVFVKIFASKTNCIVNEPILVTYKFCTRLDLKSRVLELPTFTGCSVQEMTTETNFPSFEEINGKRFKTYIIRKVQLYPLHAGDIVLGEASIESAYNVFNQGTLERKTLKLSSGSTTLHVTAFPEQNKPVGFDGAVGSFTIKTMVNRRNDTANETNSLQVMIEGEGGFQNINCPRIAFPSSVETFDAVTTEIVNKVTYPASGSKIFDIPFIVKTKGKVTIPSISFSFYDMQTHEYKTVHTEDIVINVAEAKPTVIDKTKVHENITNIKYFWIVPVIALVAGLSLWFRYGFEKKISPQQMINQADERIDAAIAEQEEMEAKREDTDTEKLNKLLLNENDHLFFSQAKKFCQELLIKETDASKINSLQKLINDCNAVLYAAGNVSKDDVLRRLEEIIL